MGVQISISRTGHTRDVDTDSQQQTRSGERDTPQQHCVSRRSPLARTYPFPSSQLSAFDARQAQNPLRRSADCISGAIRRVPSPVDFPDVYAPPAAATRVRNRPSSPPPPRHEMMRRAPSMVSVDIPIRRPASPARLVDVFDDAGYLMPQGHAVEQDEAEQERQEEEDDDASSQLTYPPRPLRRCKGYGDAQREGLARMVAQRPVVPSAAASRSNSRVACGVKKAVCSVFRGRRSDAETQQRLKELEEEGWAISSRSASVPQRRRSTSRSGTIVSDDSDTNVQPQQPNRRFSLFHQLRRLHPFKRNSSGSGGASERASSPYSWPSTSPPSTLLATQWHSSRTTTPRSRSLEQDHQQLRQQEQRRLAQQSRDSLPAMGHTSTIVLVSAADFDAARANLAQSTGSITLPAITLTPKGTGSLSLDHSSMDRGLGKQSRRTTPLKLQPLSERQRKENRILPDAPGLFNGELSSDGLFDSEYFSAVGRMN